MCVVLHDLNHIVESFHVTITQGGHANPIDQVVHGVIWAADEVIFHQDGIIQDCTFANLAFLKDGVWYTPEAPLHWGTTRARLLVEDEVEDTDILVSELHQYERICMINVFRPLSLENSIAITDAIM